MSINSDVLFSCILSDVGDYRGDPMSLWDAGSIAARKILVSNVMAKYQDGIDTKVTDGLALENFHLFNRRCKSFLLTSHLQSWESQILDGMKDLVRDFFYRHHAQSEESILLDSHLSIAHHGALGPGANIGTRLTDFYGKLFASRLTMTSDSLYYMYKDYVRHMPIWSNADKARSVEHGESGVRGSKLSFVPKNVRISRTIATEPSLNMFFQLGVGNLIRKRLRTYFGIDLATAPDINRKLARIGSTDGSHATIDLSSASDSISLSLCNWLIPKEPLSWLRLFRSQSTRLETGEWCELEHISTMGNGFTFPLQTLVFSALVVSVLKALNMPHRYGADWSVFGDDIIVPTRAFEAVNHILWLCGFIPNETKSFVKGPFRESCGHDYFNGLNVRSVYIKTLKTQEAGYVAFNSLRSWSNRLGVALPATLGYIQSRVRKMWVPEWEPPDSGLHSRCPQGDVSRTKNGLFKYRIRTPSPRYIHLSDSVTCFRYGEQKISVNADGLYLALLRGDIRDGRITPRQVNVAYRTRTKLTPNWEVGPNLFWA